MAEPYLAEELLPCPFCGEPAKSWKLGNTDWRAGCSAFPPNWKAHIAVVGTFDTEAEAITAWNTRAKPDCPDCHGTGEHHPGCSFARSPAPTDRMGEELAEAREALQDCAEPMRVLRRQAEADGAVLNSTAVAIANDASFIKQIAHNALTALRDKGVGLHE